MLSVSRAVVAWEPCKTEINLACDEESKPCKTQLSSEGTREEQSIQTGSDDTGELIAEEAKEDEQVEIGDRNFKAGGRDEMQEDDVYEEHVKSLRLTDDAANEDVEESRGKAVAEEERAMTLDDHQKMDETLIKVQVKDEEDDKIHHEDERDMKAEDSEVNLSMIAALSLEEEDNTHIVEARVLRDQARIAMTREEVEDGDGVLPLASENEDKSDQGAEEAGDLSDDEGDLEGDPRFTSVHVASQLADNNRGIVSEDELILVGQQHVSTHSSESEDAKEKEDERTLDETEQDAVIEEEDVSEVASDQAKDDFSLKTVSEDGQEEDISTGHVTCTEEFAQNAETEPITAEVTDGEQEDMATDTEVQTKTRETHAVELESQGEVSNGNTDTDIPIGETFFDKDQAEEERHSSEGVNKDGCLEVVCTTTLVTVNPEGETGQEISGEFKNIPPGTCEGRLVVSQELNSPTCEEAREGVPEHNNEPGPDENATQWFLEAGDCEEIQTLQLPEEVEGKEPESLENSGWSTGADHSLARERMEEEQESPEEIRNSFDSVVEEHADAGLHQEAETVLIEPVIQDSGVLFDEEQETLSADSMKTGIEQSEKEFESDVGSTDEIDKTAKEPQDGTEELLVDLEMDEGLCDVRETDAVVQKMAEISFFQESVEAVNSEQNSYRTQSFLEDFTESGFLKQSIETEPRLLEQSAVQMQYAGRDLEETYFGVKEEVAQDEVHNENEMETGETLIAESESLETQNQLSDAALEISNEKTEAAGESLTSESKPEDPTVISAEEVSRRVTESEGSYAEDSPISGGQDVIDEEILDLWIQTALSEDTDGIKQEEGPEPGQQIDSDTEQSNEEQHEVLSVQRDKVKEQLVELNSEESELMSDTEMSSSTAESGFSDQSLCESGTQGSETQLQDSTSSGSCQGIDDTLANMSESADISELSTQQPESGLGQETAEKGESFLKREESSAERQTEAGHLNQGSDESQGKADEENGSQKDSDADITDPARTTDRKDTEEVESLTEMSAHVQVEETKVKVEPLEISGSADEVEHTDSGRSRSGSEGSVSSESQNDTSIESEKTLLMLPSVDKLPRFSEDDSLHELNRAEMAPQPTSEDQMEVLFHV